MASNTLDFTTGSLTGNGVFDELMATLTLHLEREFKANRIIGNDYATAYTSIMNTALGVANQYALQKPLLEAQTESELIRQTTLGTESREADVRLQILELQRQELENLLPLKDDIQAKEHDILCEQVLQSKSQTIVSAAQALVADTIKTDQITSSAAQAFVDDNTKVDRVSMVAHDTATANHKASLAASEASVSNSTKASRISISRHQASIGGHEVTVAGANAEVATSTKVDKIAVSGVESAVATGTQADRINISNVESNVATATENDRVTAAHKQADLACEQLRDAKEKVRISKEQVNKAIHDSRLSRSQADQAVATEGYNINIASNQSTASAQLPLKAAFETSLAEERAATERAQTDDTVTRNSSVSIVTGVIGKQKALYEQQATSYIADRKTKAARVFADVAAVRYNIDNTYPGTSTDGFTNANTVSATNALSNIIAGA